jgi:hypothetical protein
VLTILCPYGWHESFGIMISVCASFLHIANSNFVLLRCILRSRKLMEFCRFFQQLSFILVLCSLNSTNVSSIFFL